jgi:glycosidase
MRRLLRPGCVALACAVLALPLPAVSATPATAAASAPPSTVVHPAWTRSANLYEVNIRQYTPEGSFAAFEAQLPRLQRMGVDTIWLMPVQPIGQKHRKGHLGSYYAVRDYTAVNPEFGTLADFRHLVDTAHALGMHVLIDWVANHTAWDHAWVSQHPDWYKKDEHGEIFPVTFGSGPTKEEWTDVVALDYSHKALWQAMIDAMAFWLRETGIDGFRCDVAGLVPTPFWDEARRQLDRIKPVFMLAEWNEPELHRHAFDMTYDWDLYEAMKQVAKGKATADALRELVRHPKKAYPADAYRMLFTGNHDTNSWHGSDTELYGDGFKAFVVLAATLPGLPLIYGGQESQFHKRLAFFEKDPIAWGDYPLQDLYAELLRLKHRHPALWNGAAGGPARLLDVGSRDVLAFERVKGDDRVTVVLNLSRERQAFTMPGHAQAETLPAWGWRIITAS